MALAATPPAPAARPFPTRDPEALVALAARAPSLHNTQPWRFRLAAGCVELRADSARQLRFADPRGRQLMISCGAALFGLRLGMRQLGWQSVTELLPDPAEPLLAARVRAAGRERPGRGEQDLIAALPHRYTHRGPFGPGPVPERLLEDMVRDAADEGASLVLLRDPGALHGLARLAAGARQAQHAHAGRDSEARAWTRPTAVLVTDHDTPADWLRAGQGLHRMLLRATARWVFARLESEPLESPALRDAIRDYLGLAGMPQLLLQFGRANVAAPTPRRPVTEIIDYG